jgi:hypothetical protein
MMILACHDGSADAQTAIDRAGSLMPGNETTVLVQRAQVGVEGLLLARDRCGQRCAPLGRSGPVCRRVLGGDRSRVQRSGL